MIFLLFRQGSGWVGQKPFRFISDKHGKISIDSILYPYDRYLLLFILN